MRTLFVGGALVALASVSASAQSAPPSFDVLRAAHASDSLRVTVVRQQAALAKMARVVAAKSDTIARQREELATLRGLVSRQVNVEVLTSGGNGELPPDMQPQAAPSAPVAPKLAGPSAAQDTAPAASVPAPRTAPATPASTPVATPVATRAEPPKAALPTMPAITGMIQFWVGAGSSGYRNSYRLRRAEIKASGTPAPAIAWVLMLDMGKSLSVSSTSQANGTVQSVVAQSGRPLQDATISWIASPNFRIDAGQQKIPLGLEGSQSSGTLELVERSLLASDRARGGSFGDVRDIGLVARGKLGAKLDYHVGAFNGSGESQNDVDANTAKAVVARVLLRPWSTLQLGVSGVYAGNTAADAPRRDRDAFELRYRRGNVLAQAEVVTGHDGSLSRRGGYVHAGYRLRPTLDLHARVDGWDPDVNREADAASATQRDYIAGATWTIPAASVKTQLDISRRTWSSALVPSRWQALLNLQTSW